MKGKDVTVYQAPDYIRSIVDRPVKGYGGYQNLHNKLHQQYNPRSGQLVVDPLDRDRLKRYATRGTGGYQERFKAIWEFIQ